MVEQFDRELMELTHFYRTHWYIDVTRVKPKFESLCQLVESDIAGRAEYLKRFQDAIAGLKAKVSSDVRRNLHLLDFCMRRLKWPEIGRALKAEYESIRCADTRLEVEFLIKSMYDPEWEGGEFEFLALEETLWDFCGDAEQEGADEK